MKTIGFIVMTAICLMLICSSGIVAQSRTRNAKSHSSQTRNVKASPPMEQETKLYRKTIGSIVLVQTPCKIGSGFIVGKETVITNRHVVECEKGEGFIKLLVGQERFEYRNKYLDTNNDIAVLKVPGLDEKPLVFAPAGTVKNEDTVYVIGNPLGNEGFYSGGKIVRVRQSDGYLFFDAPVAPGSSGSPVLNVIGEVVGLETTGQVLGETIFGGAVPAKNIKTFQALVEKGSVADSFNSSPTGETTASYLPNKTAPSQIPAKLCTAEQLRSGKPQAVLLPEPYWSPALKMMVKQSVLIPYEVRVDENGVVKSVRLLKTQTLIHPMIQLSTKKAAERARFTPLGCEYETDIQYQYRP